MFRADLLLTLATITVRGFMRRALLLLILGAVVAIAALYTLRRTQQTSTATVASLLPNTTVALVHLPDFNQTMDEWHASDVYQIYREPAVQEFLHRPGAAQNPGISGTLQQLEELKLKDGFIAFTSVADDKPKVVAGLNYHCRQEVADRIVDDWTGRIQNARREVIPYQQHDIAVFAQAGFLIAIVRDRDWLFAGNDLDELKAVIDRADGRVKDRDTLLNTDKSYQEGRAAMPTNYALLIYVQPKTFGERLAVARAAIGAADSSEERTLIEQIRCLCGTMRFESGKMHDVIFVGMPKQEQAHDLTRSSLSLATRSTFLYTASTMNFSKQLALLTGTNANLFGAGLQKVSRGLAAAGISASDWNLAFDSEAGLAAEWPPDVHWPSAVVSCGVKDKEQAKRIAAALTKAIDEDGTWSEMDRNGVHYWSMTTMPTLFAIRPVIGLSNRVLVGGFDIKSIEVAVQRSETGNSELASSDVYRRAVHELPQPTNFFSYVDLGLLLTRIDATFRPLLFMGAAFMPSIADQVDLNKLPTAEVITKHLSPIVSSQHYAGNGYIAESIGPVTLSQSAVGIGLIAGFGTLAGQRNGWPSLGLPGQPSPSPSTGGAKGGKGAKIGPTPTAAPSPTGTP